MKYTNQIRTPAEEPMRAIKNNKLKPTIITPLYRHVFYGRFSTVVVFVLLGSILLQPIDRVHASSSSEGVVPPAPLNTATVTTTEAVTNTLELESPPLSDVVTDTSLPVETLAATSTPDQPLEIPLADPNHVIHGEAVASTSLPFSPSPDISDTSLALGSTTSITPDVLPDASSTDPADQTDSVTPDVPALNPDSIVPDHSSSTDLLTNATTTGDVFQVKGTVTSDSQIQFEKSDCIAVADGSYYCRTKEPALVDAVKDGLYSKPDADGDLEIFFAHDGVLSQITHNTVDDASPFFDAISDTIVWHRIIDDRYQIISYDIKSGSESQLTSDTVNNMEPNRAGKYTVWQHWNNGNWDIMLYDGAVIKLLTDTPQHDIAPVIRGNLVMWNRLTSDNVQTIELYDITTGEYTTINDTEGGALSNPRMVLVYDAQFKNGDVITKGYDVTTGKITSLSAIPAKVPDKIPAPDTTGETRALIQAKSTSREDGEQSLPQPPTIDPPVPGGLLAGSTNASSTLTVQLQTATTTPTLVATTSALTLTLDLSGSTSLQIIESDVVVPSFSATSTTE